LSKKLFYRWGRQAGALVSVISVCVIAGAACGDRAWGLPPAIVLVTELGNATGTKPVIVTHNSPDIQKGGPTSPAFFNLLQRKALLTALSSGGPRSNYDSSRFLFIGGKVNQATIKMQFHANAPRNLMGRQFPSVFNPNMADDTITIFDKMNTEWLNSQVGALEDSRVTYLIGADDGQNNCEKSDDQRRDCRHRIVGSLDETAAQRHYETGKMFFLFLGILISGGCLILALLR
jgi:hypothetical protein